MAEQSYKRFLVTTALESTWNQERSILFLGEWCRQLSRHGTWRCLNAELQPYHWDDREKYFRDYHYLGLLHERKLGSLSQYLGQMHGVTQEVRYWRIIIGPWLRFFTDAVFDRFELIRGIAESENVDDTWVLRYDLSEWVPMHFSQFYSQFTDDAWNHIIFAECIKWLGLPYTERESPLRAKPASESFRTRIKHLARWLLGFYGRLLPSRFNRVAIVDAYMPRVQLFALQRALGQWPFLFSPVLTRGRNPYDQRKRELLKDDNPSTPFEKLLNALISTCLPTAYLENFDDLQTEALAKFPRDPKVIVTANAYQADEGFKIWAAHHATKGVPIVIAQHGGNFGIGRVNQTEDHQVRIADVFASWGWNSKCHSTVRPLPALKLTAKSPRSVASGDILVTLASLPRYFYCHFSFPVAGQFLDYIEEQLRFMRLLDRDIQRCLKVRLVDDRFGWDVAERLKLAGMGWAIDSVGGDLGTRLNSCRIAVSTYNATVFLETLAGNFPSLVFFDPKRFEVRPEAKSAMDRLREVGILHDTPEAAARFLNRTGREVEKWWRSTGLQATRTDFCYRYARTSTDWVGSWKSMFCSLSA